MNPETIMRIVITLICLYALATLARASFLRHVACDQIDLTRMADAILQCENTPWEKIGLYGERSSYQITECVWKQHTIAAFTWASDPHPACRRMVDKLVIAHLAWICRTLKADGYTLTPYIVAEVWKGGIGRFRRMQMRPPDIQYAIRCNNLYAENRLASSK